MICPDGVWYYRFRFTVREEIKKFMRKSIMVPACRIHEKRFLRSTALRKLSSWC